MFKRKDVAAAWIMLAIGSALLRFFRWGHPQEVAFDEVLIGNFLSHYFSGAYYFDIHPPHMKLWYALLLKCAGFSPAGFGFPKVESVYPGSYYLWARGFAAVCGAAVPLLAAWIAMALGARKAWAFAVGAALAMDGALIVESRFMLNDMPMLCFGLAGWAACLKWRVSGRSGWLALGCLGLAAASSVKWTGLAFSIPVGMGLIWCVFRSNKKRLNAWALCALMGSALAWHMAGYAIHFSLLDKPGPGNAFMSNEFNARLVGDRPALKVVKPLSWLSAVGELHYKMAFYADKVGPHPYSSSWLSWPVGTRGIYVWNERSGGAVNERIYMLPNLVLWWCVALAMARMALMQIPRGVGRAMGWRVDGLDVAKLGVSCSYLALWLPYAFIDRPMFLYHYFPALALGSIGLAMECSGMQKPEKTAMGWIVACGIAFVWVAPLTYGIGLDASGLSRAMLLKSWP